MDQIAVAETYWHKGKYTKSRAFGLSVADLGALPVSGWHRKFMESLKGGGHHFHCSGDSTLESLTVIEHAVNYYRAHPERREELATGAALERIRALESENDLARNFSSSGH
jgi:hypothetical protein